MEIQTSQRTLGQKVVEVSSKAEGPSTRAHGAGCLGVSHRILRKI